MFGSVCVCVCRKSKKTWNFYLDESNYKFTVFIHIDDNFLCPLIIHMYLQHFEKFKVIPLK